MSSQATFGIAPYGPPSSSGPGVSQYWDAGGTGGRRVPYGTRPVRQVAEPASAVFHVEYDLRDYAKVATQVVADVVAELRKGCNKQMAVFDIEHDLSPYSRRLAELPAGRRAICFKSVNFTGLLQIGKFCRSDHDSGDHDGHPSRHPPSPARTIAQLLRAAWAGGARPGTRRYLAENRNDAREY
jgi:hypothetical protein